MHLVLNLDLKKNNFSRETNKNKMIVTNAVSQAF
jgi:hypothetical protein